MADGDAAVPVVAPAKTSWPDVALTALHYAAGGALVAGSAYMTSIGKLDGQVFVVILMGAAAAVGLKMKGS